VATTARRRRASTVRRPTFTQPPPNFVTGVNRTPIIPRPLLHPQTTNAQLDEQKIISHATALAQAPFPLNLTILVRTQAARSFLAHHDDGGTTKEHFPVTEIPTIGKLITACKDFGVKGLYDLDAQCKVALLCTITSHAGKVLWIKYIKLRTETGFPARETSDPAYTQFLMQAMEVARNIKVEMEESGVEVDIGEAMQVKVVIVHDLPVPAGVDAQGKESGMVGMNMGVLYGRLEGRVERVVREKSAEGVVVIKG
jgi:hypothetical protein